MSYQAMHDRLEALAYERDSRNCDLATVPTVTLIRNGAPIEVKLPMRWVVCDVCQGRGTHVNPSIDCNGLTAEDFDDDPDFREDYFRGAYDQACNRCGGRTTVPEVNEEALTDEQRKAYEAQQEEEARRAEYDRQSYAERRAEFLAGC